MSEQKTSTRRSDRAAGAGIPRPRMLYQILLQEYETLKLLTKTEADEIRNEDRQRRKDDGLRSMDEVDKIPDRREREQERKEQFEKRRKFRAGMLALIRRKIHQKAKNDHKITALCLSGGGIRSATFGLGVLQGLAKHNLLAHFDYLSTVSGGGYIGSWFSAWLYREGSIAKVQSALCRNRLHPFLFGLKDFDCSFEEYSEDSIDRVMKLQETLKRNQGFFYWKEIVELARTPLPSKTELLKDKFEMFKLRAFVQNLCEELNRVLLTEESGSVHLKTGVSEDDAAFQRIKAKRLALGEELDGLVKPPDETDTIEPYEITHLRSFSNYMSPRMGVSSTDTWTLVTVYLRNLLLNWTVLVPLLAAILLLPQAFYALLNLYPAARWQFFALALATACGLLGVINLNAMRPTLEKFSWVDQRYKSDDIGELQSTEGKVLRWCLTPLVALAFGLILFWVWMSRDGLGFPLGFLIDEKVNSYVNPTLVHLIIFSEILFFGGFLVSRAALLFRGDANKPKGLWKNFVGEFLISFFSAALGGALLYAIVYFVALSNVISKEYQMLFYACFGAPLILISFLLSTMIFVGLASKITDDMDREWAARLGAWILLAAVGWALLASIVLLGPKLFDYLTGEYRSIMKAVIGAIGGISGLITLVLGFSRRSAGKQAADEKSKSSFLLQIAPQIAAPVFALFLTILLVYATNSLIDFTGSKIWWLRLFENPKDHLEALQNIIVIAIWGVFLAGIGIASGFFININKFSLHATYRERLIRAYLGASRAKERLETANSFTGLDGADNLEMRNLLQKPFHVVNMTLNMVKSNNLRWQNRKAESFTATALHCGSSNMGVDGNYRDSKEYAYNSQNDKAMTLGTAASISGAAASPNMGYYTSSVAVSFLMALFNIRLGWWLGNPGRRGDTTYKLPAPSFSPRPFFDEALGLTDDTNPYIYLSDGGHFENLGLYEMVLRRCHLIVVCDAGADSKFGFFDFGTAIHKIRVDMGIPIEFEQENAPLQGRNCGIAKIRYRAVDGKNAEDGMLIYIKPTLDGNEPIDIVNYSRSNPDFPHETTADQLYSETQFESYRSLGFHMINSLCCGEDHSPCRKCKSLADLRHYAGKYLGKLNKNETIWIEY